MSPILGFVVVDTLPLHLLQVLYLLPQNVDLLVLQVYTVLIGEELLLLDVLALGFEVLHQFGDVLLLFWLNVEDVAPLP